MDTWSKEELEVRQTRSSDAKDRKDGRVPIAAAATIGGLKVLSLYLDE
jgi:hypothetical protein